MVPTRPAFRRNEVARNTKEVRRSVHGPSREAPPLIAMDSFLTACGASGLLTLEIEGPGFPVPERRVFSQPFVLVGRDDRADLLLDHDAISRRHTYLQVVEGRLFFIDLDSRIGTSAGEGMTESGWLEPGRGLDIGPFTLRQAPFPGVEVALPPPTSPLLARSAATPSDLPSVSLEFQSRTAGHSVWRMSQVLALVGSSPRCKVRLFDSQVSKLHCALMRTPGGLWAVDLLGRGGMAVNGMPVRHSQLRPGDFLSLGQVVVRANFEDAAARGAAPVPVVRPGRGPAPDWNSRTEIRPVPGTNASNPPAPMTPLFGPGNTDLAAQEPALALLLNHFGQMQQQMMDQFQQSMMMMFQMFGGMHRDQMGLVKEELERLRELTGEIATIKAELAQRSMQPAAPPPPPPPSPSQYPPFGGYTRPLNGGWGGGPANPRPWSEPAPAPPRSHTPESPTYWPGSPSLRPTAEPSPPRAPTASPGAPSEDVHEWLNERLNAITTEQQTRWQKIMTLIRGAR
jgi:pSer/pThr/pTyr-binding forkhead associated (FHA) protein